MLRSTVECYAIVLQKSVSTFFSAYRFIVARFAEK